MKLHCTVQIAGGHFTQERVRCNKPCMMYNDAQNQFNLNITCNLKPELICRSTRESILTTPDIPLSSAPNLKGYNHTEVEPKDNPEMQIHRI